jgi:hypothetical protein
MRFTACLRLKSNGRYYITVWGVITFLILPYLAAHVFYQQNIPYSV